MSENKIMKKKIISKIFLSCVCQGVWTCAFVANCMGEGQPSKKTEEEKKSGFLTNFFDTSEKNEKCDVQENKHTKTVVLPSVVDIRKGFSEVVQKALPSVVNIATTQLIESKNQADISRFNGNGSSLEELFRDFMGPHMGGGAHDTPKRVQSLGSGFVIKISDKTMYIVTNHHVVSEAKKITVFFHDKSYADASVHAMDERTDIAVLKVNMKQLPDQGKTIAALEWADDEAAQIGDWVLAIGNPFGLGSSVTNGIISSKGRDLLTTGGRGRGNSYVDDFIQHSAQINMGNSGGCLLDMSGKVLGVNTAILSPSGGNVGVGFATPAGVAKKTVNQLIDYGRTKRGWLGVSVQHMTEEALESLGLKGQGDMVREVTTDGPAEKAGIKPDDLIIEYNGKKINDINRITRLVGETPVGQEVPVKVYREGKELLFTIKVGEYEEAIKDGKLDSKKSSKVPLGKETINVLGMKVTTLSHDQLKKGHHGVVVVDRPHLGVGSELSVGDIIESVNMKDINQEKPLEHFKAMVTDAKAKKHQNLLLGVIKDMGSENFENGKGPLKVYITIKFDDELMAKEAPIEKTPPIEPKENAKKK